MILSFITFRHLLRISLRSGPVIICQRGLQALA